MSLSKQITDSCEIYNIDYELLDSKDHPSISDTILLFNNYSKTAPNSDNVVSIALALNGSNGWLSKCWLSNNKTRSINGQKPELCPGYENFIYKDIKYHPFSVDLSGYTVNDTLKLCNDIYEHINFSNE